MAIQRNYRYVYCPPGVQSRYSLIVLDEENQPHIPLTDFYHDQLARKSNSTALSYLKSVLSFFHYLGNHSNYQGNSISWTDEPHKIRVAIEDYLQHQMHCKVQEKDTFQLVRLTNKSPNTVSRFLSALKACYKSLILLKHYHYPNPLLDAQAVLNPYADTPGVRKDKLRMPAAAGTEDPIPTRRLTDSYFKLVNNDWEPHIIGDPHLPYQVYQAGKQAGWSLRDRLIVRLLFETGARLSEVAQLVVGDYRNRKDFQEASTFNKGSHGRRVKFLRFGKDSVKLLHQYINGERRECDPEGRVFEELPNDAPLFLSDRGTAYNREALYYHWQKAMRAGGLDLNPHKARHWFVTTRLREIYRLSRDANEIARRKKELIRYMGWKHDDTLQVYEHYFDEEHHRQAHDEMLENMKLEEKRYLAERKNQKKKPQLTLHLRGKEELRDELEDFFDELE